MKKNFRLTGLDCANCAAKMERGIQKIDGVSEANINFMTLKLAMEFDEAKKESVLAAMEAAVHKVDPNVVIKKA